MSSISFSSEPSPEGFPSINTKNLEEHFKGDEMPAFYRGAFVALVYAIIRELHLLGKIESIDASGELLGFTQLWFVRENGKPKWRHLGFDIDPKRYLEENLVRHEFHHLADRYDLAMEYCPKIDEPESWHAAMNLAANISVDARLGERGLGKQYRWEEEFQPFFHGEHKPLFEEQWANPPKTWFEIEALATRLSELKSKQSQAHT